MASGSKKLCLQSSEACDDSGSCEVFVQAVQHFTQELATDNRNDKLILGSGDRYEPNQTQSDIFPNQELAIEIGTDNISGSQLDSGSNQFDLPPLPDIVVREILRTVPDWPTIQALLNCRLVSVQWNQIIEDTSELMKKITFPIWHPIPFLQLPIVQRGKVKSIILKNYFSPKYATMLMDKISDTVEKVQFAFEDSFTKEHQREMFLTILLECKNLQELIIGDYSTRQKCLSQPVQNWTWSFGISGQVLPSAAKIRFITVNMNCFTMEDSYGLVDLLLSLPKLEDIKLACLDSYGKYFSTILAGICKYLTVNKSDLRLKKLGLAPEGRPLRKTNHKAFVSLLIECAKHPTIALSQMPYVNFNKLLAVPESQVLFSKFTFLQRPVLNIKFAGRITFNTPVVKNLDRLLALDIQKLDLVFKRNCMEEDVSWIKSIANLESLSLACHKEIRTRCLPQPSAKALEPIPFESANGGFPALKILKLNQDLLDISNVSRWAEYFPNLQELWISSYKTTPADLISQLTLFESLSTLQLSDLPTLDDVSFTTERVNRFSSYNDRPLKSPAIACFKELKHLRLYGCSKLTSECILNGIRRCKTLQTVVIQNCGSISETCKSWVTNCEAYISNNAEEYFSCSSESEYDSSEDSFEYLSDQSDDASFVSESSDGWW